ncbi:MAG TPA: ABC transporter permease [Actinomycetota bacterium]|nr:ABC transporter permease [Actinomycetota bacterium]
MNDALKAEWTKLRTVPSPLWLLAASVVLVIAAGAAAASTATYPPFNAVQDTTKTALTGVLLGQAVIAILAVLTVTSEYSFGTIRLTLTAVPRRLELFAAKAVLLAGLTLVAGTVAVLGSLLAGRLILQANGFTPAHGYALVSLAHGSTVRAAVGSVLYLTLIALLALGAATMLRDTAAAIGAALGALYLFPILGGVVSDPTWQRHLTQIGPMTAGLGIQTTVNVHSLTLTPWTGLGVSVLWAAGAMAAGGLLLSLRDA